MEVITVVESNNDKLVWSRPPVPPKRKSPPPPPPQRGADYSKRSGGGTPLPPRPRNSPPPPPPRSTGKVPRQSKSYSKIGQLLSKAGQLLSMLNPFSKKREAQYSSSLPNQGKNMPTPPPLTRESPPSPPQQPDIKGNKEFLDYWEKEHLDILDERKAMPESTINKDGKAPPPPQESQRIEGKNVENKEFLDYWTQQHLDTLAEREAMPASEINKDGRPPPTTRSAPPLSAETDKVQELEAKVGGITIRGVAGLASDVKVPDKTAEGTKDKPGVVKPDGNTPTDTGPRSAPAA